MARMMLHMLAVRAKCSGRKVVVACARRFMKTSNPSGVLAWLPGDNLAVRVVGWLCGCSPGVAACIGFPPRF